MRPKVASSNTLCLTNVECIQIVKVRVDKSVENLGKSSEISKLSDLDPMDMKSLCLNSALRIVLRNTMEKIANQLEHIRTKPRFFGPEVWELF